jgi:KDO2-lipid IV(A) lauroyltransferase
MTRYFFIRVAVLVLQSLPYGIALGISRMLAVTAHAVRFRHDVMHGNLVLALGDDVDEAGRQRIASEVYRHWGRTFMADIPHLLRTVRRDNWSSVVDVTALGPLQQLHAEGRGVILLSGHLGNPEFGGWLGALVGLPIYSVANLQDNPRLNSLLEKLRTSSGQRILYKQGALRKGREVLERGDIVAVLADLNDRREGITVDFFGREASTIQGPAALSVRSGAPILPVAFVRDGHGPHYHVAYGDPIRPVPGASLGTEIHRITQAYTSALERFIRLWPEQWVWFHRRWKEPRTLISPSTGIHPCASSRERTPVGDIS